MRTLRLQQPGKFGPEQFLQQPRRCALLPADQWLVQADDAVDGFQAGLAEDLATEPLGQIACNRTRRETLGDNHAQTRMSKLIGANVEHEIFCPKRGPQTKNG